VKQLAEASLSRAGCVVGQKPLKETVSRQTMCVASTAGGFGSVTGKIHSRAWRQIAGWAPEDASAKPLGPATTLDLPGRIAPSFRWGIALVVEPEPPAGFGQAGAKN